MPTTIKKQYHFPFWSNETIICAYQILAAKIMFTLFIKYIINMLLNNRIQSKQTSALDCSFLT